MLQQADYPTFEKGFSLRFDINIIGETPWSTGKLLFVFTLVFANLLGRKQEKVGSLFQIWQGFESSQRKGFPG
jgi:hypothetical protein